MELGQLDHINLRTSNLDEMIAWYERVLGMKSGERPRFKFTGAWLYCNGNPFVHLVGVEHPPSGTDPKLEHFAFSAKGLCKFIDQLKSEGMQYEIREISDTSIIQVNIWDPDGNHIHVDFSLRKAEGLKL